MLSFFVDRQRKCQICLPQSEVTTAFTVSVLHINLFVGAALLDNGKLLTCPLKVCYVDVNGMTWTTVVDFSISQPYHLQIVLASV